MSFLLVVDYCLLQRLNSMLILLSASGGLTLCGRRCPVNVHICPEARYFDRHTNCHRNNHVHVDLLRNRPRTACSRTGPSCPSNYSPRIWMDDHRKKEMEEESNWREKHHATRSNTHSWRPATAPTTVRNMCDADGEGAISL